MHALRPLRGQQDAAANVLALLEGSAINESHRWCDKVQDAYSLRCAPQVHGAARDLLDYVDYTVSVELNAATDNPLVLVDDEMLVSNGNFHGQPVAFALDALAMAVAELASISERRVERLVNPNLSDGLPPFLTTDGGLNSGFMIPQYVAASLVSENKVLAHPASVDSIPTSAGQEDHVSMGNAAGLKAWQVLANAEWALAIELLAGVQGVEFLAPLEPGRGVAAARGFVRALSPRLIDDRPLAGEIDAVAAAIRDGSLVRRGRGRGRSAAVKKLPLGHSRPGGAEAPVPRQAIAYAVLAGIVVGVTALTGGDVARAAIIAFALFVGATAYSWWRWRERIREAERGMSATETLDATVESLCGDLSTIRAPRGQRPERALVVDGGAAAHAAEQPRPARSPSGRRSWSSTAARAGRRAATTR